MKTAITPTRQEDFNTWYQNLIVEADLAENSPVRGCMTVKPYGWAIWELMKNEMDKRIKSRDVNNVCFPLLIPIDFLSKEADHVDKFAKECAVVTHYRLKKIDGKIKPDPESCLTEPYIIRPTSETIIGEAMSRWVKSYRDLPLKLNQWVNVMRWEMRTRIFLRTSEFYWQEGHNAFKDHESASRDAKEMLFVYYNYMRDILAIDGIIGEKTPEERFGGADHTYTVEQIMQDGKALQSATSHDLGQHFSKAFDIKFLNESGVLENAWTTSWGSTTRMMGALFMSHSDDDGLILPPSVAPYQIVVIPVVKTENQDKVFEYAKKVGNYLEKKGIRVLTDLSDNRSSDKIWNWIKKGVPLRIEVGEKELNDSSITFTRRDIGKESKRTLKLEECDLVSLLDTIQKDMLILSTERNKKMITEVSSLNELEINLSEGKIGFFKIEYDKTLNKEFEELSDKYKISRRCLDYLNPEFVYVAKSY